MWEFITKIKKGNAVKNELQIWLFEALYEYSTVHCRTGSLEMNAGGDKTGCRVHCRTGSLEIGSQAAN